jgi:hypothetical protein
MSTSRAYPIGSCHTTSGKAAPGVETGPICRIVVTGFPGTAPRRVCITPFPWIYENTDRPRGRLARAMYSLELAAWSWMMPHLPASGPYATQKVSFGALAPSTERRKTDTVVACLTVLVFDRAQAGVREVVAANRTSAVDTRSFMSIPSLNLPAPGLFGQRSGAMTPLYDPRSGTASDKRRDVSASNDVVRASSGRYTPP